MDSVSTTQVAPYAPSNLSYLNYSAQKSSTLSLRTNEGDAVQISLSSGRELQYLTYGASGTKDGQGSSVGVEAFQYTSTQSASIAVEGSLNQKELHDIHKTLQTVEKAARDLEKGHLFQALKRIGQLEKYETISELSASVTTDTQAHSLFA